jgi:hypothetical protein
VDACSHRLLEEGMSQKRFGKSDAYRGIAVAIVVGTVVLGFGSAQAAQLYDGEKVDVRLDSTIATGVTVRAASRDMDMVYVGNGGTNVDPAYSSFDNGNLNYDGGDVTSTAAKLTMDLELIYSEPLPWLREIGAFVRANGFYDVVQNCGHCTRRTRLAPEARHRPSVIEGGVVGTQFRVLDAYAFGSVDVLDRLIDVRVGNQVISWGESLFIPGGINQINGFDVSKFRSPGSEIKEALVPAPAIRVSSKIIERLSFEGYYQFAWFRTQLDPVGTFFSTNDLIGRGTKGLYINSSVLSPGTGDEGSPNPSPILVRRQGEETPSDQGQGGVALRYYWDRIFTEFGAYYLRYHSKQPALGFAGVALLATNPDTGNGVGLSPAVPPFFTGYYVEQYAEGIDLVGASFSTEVFGAALAGEISYRPNDPVSISASATPTSAPNFTFPVFSDGYVREKRIQAQASTIVNMSSSTRLIGPVVGFSQADDLQLIAELAVVNYPDLAPICPVKGVPALGCIAYATAPDRTADATSFGYQLLMQGNYANPFDVPITLTPRVSFSHDAVGDSPGQQPFVEGRKAVAVGLKVDYLATWVFDVSYANFMGAGTANLNRDRDFVAASLSYSF